MAADCSSLVFEREKKARSRFDFKIENQKLLSHFAVTTFEQEKGQKLCANR